MSILMGGVAACKRPSPEVLGKFVGPVGDCIVEADQLSNGRRGAMFNHQKAVAEFLQSLTWVVYTGKECGMSLPAPHVAETWGAAEFYTNKILVEFRNTVRARSSCAARGGERGGAVPAAASALTRPAPVSALCCSRARIALTVVTCVPVARHRRMVALPTSSGPRH